MAVVMVVAVHGLGGPPRRCGRRPLVSAPTTGMGRLPRFHHVVAHGVRRKLFDVVRGQLAALWELEGELQPWRWTVGVGGQARERGGQAREQEQRWRGSASGHRAGCCTSAIGAELAGARGLGGAPHRRAWPGGCVSRAATAARKCHTHGPPRALPPDSLVSRAGRPRSVQAGGGGRDGRWPVQAGGAEKCAWWRVQGQCSERRFNEEEKPKVEGEADE